LQQTRPKKTLAIHHKVCIRQQTTEKRSSATLSQPNHWKKNARQKAQNFPVNVKRFATALNYSKKNIADHKVASDNAYVWFPVENTQTYFYTLKLDSTALQSCLEHEVRSNFTFSKLILPKASFWSFCGG